MGFMERINKMNKFERLISEFCPNGVEYKMIKECVLNIEKINWKKHLGDIYKYIDLTSVDRDVHKILETQQIRAENAPARAQQIVKSGDILFGTTRPMLKRFCMVTDEYNNEICSTGFCVLRVDKKILLNRWLYHIISSSEFFYHVERFQKGTSYPAISDTDVKAFSFPVPPLEVQNEIVHILDNFTELTKELTKELTTRKKQYEYYRNKLLDPKNSIKKYILGDIATVTKLAGFEFTKYVKYSNKGNLIAIRGLNVKNGKLNLQEVKYIDQSDLSKLTRSKLYIGDMLFTYVGTIGEVALIEEEEKYYLAPNVALIRCNKEILLPEFMKYYFQSNYFKEKQIKRLLQNSSMKNIPMEKIRKFDIYIPSLDVQQRIVTILDHFDTLCNDLTTGLPAEIEARKKQYEYYRDKLLSF